MTDNTLDTSLSLLEAEAFNFAVRNIQDANVRKSYMRQTQQMSMQYRSLVKSGALSASEAASQVQVLRNEIMEAHRLKSSDIGKAKAISLKTNGLSLNELCEKYAKKMFNKPYSYLTETQKNKVYLEIIESSGRSRPSVNAAAGRLHNVGRGLLVLTVGIAVYNIATAEDKAKATAREGVVLGGGFAGGAAGGAAAGLVCGPGAPVCVTIGVFIGGALGALGADFAFGRFTQ